jgi:hypothetical protein
VVVVFNQKGKVMGKTNWKISIDDGYCEFQYSIKIDGDECVDSVMNKIAKLFKTKKLNGVLRMTYEQKQKKGKEKVMKEWEPSEKDLEWCRMLISTLSDGGVWGTSEGIYKKNDKKKTLERINKAEIRGAGGLIHERNIIAFGKIGWKVTDKTEGK